MLIQYAEIRKRIDIIKYEEGLIFTNFDESYKKELLKNIKKDIKKNDFSF